MTFTCFKYIARIKENGTMNLKENKERQVWEELEGEMGREMRKLYYNLKILLKINQYIHQL